MGLLYAYAGTSRLSGGTFTGINIPQEAVLNGKGIIYLADSEAAARTAMEGMPAAGKKFDQAVLTAADPAPMAYCPGPVSIVNDSATSSSGGSSYSPILEKTENGAASFSPKRPKRGDEVTITPAPDEGYQVAEIIVTGNSGEKIKVTDNADGTYRFTQPRGRVTVHMVFRKIRAAEACLRDGTCPIRTFTDADVNDWYHDGVHYCLENGLMAGTGATTFAPHADTSRAMIATILWRLEGSPEVDHLMDYADVPGDAWYAEAVRWATAKGVASGYGAGCFGPEDAVTREQLAAILYRYEQSKGDGAPETQMFCLDYSDVDQVSE